MTIARSAADEADRLGEEVIRNGLDMDLRAEAAIDELEGICGVSLNVTSILGTAEPQTEPAVDGACRAGYVLDGGAGEICFLDPIELARNSAATDADRDRLDACLGESTTIEWVTLGSRPVCIWEYDGVPDSTCLHADSEHPCPFPAVTGTEMGSSVWTCDAGGLPLMTETVTRDGMDEIVRAESIAVTTTLDLFDNPEPEDLGLPPMATADYPCALLAAARESPDIASVSWPLLFSPFIEHGTRFASLAERLDWVAAAGDFSRVTWDGTTIFGTGGPIRGVSNIWPCGPPPPVPEGAAPLCPRAAGPEVRDPHDWAADADASLFCLQVDCGGGASGATGDARVRRARMNDMLARAVIAVRVLAGASMEGIEVPFYPRHLDTDNRADVTFPGLASPGWTNARPSYAAGANYYSAASGALRTDDVNDGNDGDARDFGALRLHAEYIDGSPIPTDSCPAGGSGVIPSGAEWVLCPYDLSTCVEVFDDATDCDDVLSRTGWDGNLPLLLRELPSLRAEAAARTSASLWELTVPDTAAPLVGVALAPFLADDPMDTTVPTLMRRYAFPSSMGHFAHDGGEGGGVLADITEYWLRSGCGDFQGGACRARGTESDGFYGRHRDEVAVTAQDSRACPGVFSGEIDPLTGAVTNCTTIGCTGNTYEGCAVEAAAHRIDFRTSFDGNRAFIAPAGLTYGDVLNGMELLCAASRDSGPDLNFGCTEPPVVDSVLDMLNAERFLECRANGIRAMGANAVTRDLPARVVELLRSSDSAILGEVSGEYGAQVSELRGAYVSLRTSSAGIADALSAIATSTRTLRNAIARSDVSRELEEVELASSVMDRITTCAVAATNAIGDSLGGKALAAGLNAQSAALTCINSVVQVALAVRVRDLRIEGILLQDELAFIDFDRDVNLANSALTAEFVNLQTALERIDAAQARIRSLQDNGRRAVTRALMLDSDATGRHYAVDTVMRRRYATSLYRYREAHTRAVRLAYIARIALEQRLGMSLSSMTDPMVTVDAPATWADGVCNIPSIDYDRVRDAVGASGDLSTFPGPEGYAGAFVGDYVRRLEQVFESYSFAYPFHEGEDTVVLSLRDDVLRVRESCAVPGPNLLYQAGHLVVDATPDSFGWESAGCADLPDWPTGPAAPLDPAGPTEPAAPLRPHCVTVSALELDPAESPIPEAAADFGRPGAFLVEFGSVAPTNLDAVDYWGVTQRTRWLQHVDLPRGRFRLSWYGRHPTNLPPGAPAPTLSTMPYAVLVGTRNHRTETVGGVSRHVWDEFELPSNEIASEDVGNGWFRAWQVFENATGASAVVQIRTQYPASPPYYYTALEVAGFMLEDVSGVVPSGTSPDPNEVRPGAFFDTTDVLTRRLPVCEDTDGNVFRSAWVPGFVRVCPDGFDGDCSGASAERRAFVETIFPISVEALQRTLGGAPTGFASGNYNYRFETLALNLVGTGLRSCEIGTVETPSGCFASGNLSYSILHSGPFIVGGPTGAPYAAPIFPGRIESARALAAERYLTNPISSADAALIGEYIRPELVGRPLHGSVTVRLWLDDGFVFENLEDVQLVLRYRYWTHQR